MSGFISVGREVRYKCMDYQGNVANCGWQLYDTNKRLVSTEWGTQSMETPDTGGYSIRVFFPTTLETAQWGIFLSSVNTFSEFVDVLCYPLYKADLAKDFEKESGEMFFREKLSGALTFVGPDYDYIMGQAFDHQFIVTIFISQDGGASWTQYWRGEFYKTDCEIDLDARTIVVKPSVLDAYTNILAGIEKEFDLISLAPEIVRVYADKRPMIQIYVPGQTVIGCFLSNMWWEQECDAVTNVSTLINTYKFTKIRTLRQYAIGGAPSDVPEMLLDVDPSGSTFSISQGGYTFSLVYDITTDPENPMYIWQIVRNSDSLVMWRTSSSSLPTIPYTVTLAPVNGTGSVTITVTDTDVYGRYVLDLAEVNGVATFAIPSNDIVENNRNYKYCMGYSHSSTIVFSTELSETATKWGLYQPGQYYKGPYTYGQEAFPVCRNAWGRVSIWFYPTQLEIITEKDARAQFIIRDAYPLTSVLSVLLSAINAGVTFGATQNYSQFFFGTSDPHFSYVPVLVPKSNVISANYDQPAQKAPITLRQVLDMLRDCFRCYWYIENGRLRIEQVRFFMNGGSYSSTPGVGTDLTAQKVSRNGKAWAFGRNQYKFDKPEMPERYQFGWMDDVTTPFAGYPIDLISGYVQKGQIEDITVNNFTSDIDFILLNPSEISKDGFAVLGTEYTPAVAEYTYSLDGYSLRNYNISPSTGLWGTNSSYKHILIPVTPGNKLSITAGTNVARLAWFTSNAAATSGGTPQYVSGTSLFSQTAGTTEEYTVPSGAAYMYIYSGQNNRSYLPSDVHVVAVPEHYVIPYYTYGTGSTNILQNGYLSFAYLQRYYFYDMPGRNFTINGANYTASGVKRLKNQAIKFPLRADPNLLQLIKTDLGDGKVEKLSITLSSRQANATLYYDTEQ